MDCDNFRHVGLTPCSNLSALKQQNRYQFAASLTFKGGATILNVGV